MLFVIMHSPVSDCKQGEFVCCDRRENISNKEKIVNSSFIQCSAHLATRETKTAKMVRNNSDQNSLAKVLRCEVYFL